jgi:formate-dependent nitrite reductase membrane component NrfD
VFDLERPERFYYILTRPNWRSWLVWGTYFLIAHSGIAAMWVAAGWFGVHGVITALAIPAIVASLLATSYTGFLFAQGLARDLWQGPHAAIDLMAQAVIEGAAALLIALAIVPSLRAGGNAAAPLVLALGAALTVHLVFLAVEHLTPSPTRHHELATRAISRGAFAPFFWGGAIVGGGLLPLALLGAGSIVESLQSPVVATLVAALALAGAFAWEYVWVEAGQSVPLS